MYVYIYIYMYICICTLTYQRRLQRVTDFLLCVSALQHTATHCNTLQHPSAAECCLHAGHAITATHCNSRHRTATHCNIPQLQAAADIEAKASGNGGYSLGLTGVLDGGVALGNHRGVQLGNTEERDESMASDSGGQMENGGEERRVGGGGGRGGHREEGEEERWSGRGDGAVEDGEYGGRDKMAVKGKEGGELRGIGGKPLSDRHRVESTLKDKWNGLRYSLHHTATHCITLQHTATHCNTLQHTATHCTHCYTLLHAATGWFLRISTYTAAKNYACQHFRYPSKHVSVLVRVWIHVCVCV